MKKSNWHSNWCLTCSNFPKIQGRSFPLAKNSALIGEIGHDHSVSGHLAIDGRDHASIDRNGAIKYPPSHHRWRIMMRPRYTL